MQEKIRTRRWIHHVTGFKQSEDKKMEEVGSGKSCMEGNFQKEPNSTRRCRKKKEEIDTKSLFQIDSHESYGLARLYANLHNYKLYILLSYF